MRKIIVLDTEVNEEFEVIEYRSADDKVTIRNLNYGFCSQDKDKLKFVRVED